MIPLLLSLTLASDLPCYMVDSRGRTIDLGALCNGEPVSTLPVTPATPESFVVLEKFTIQDSEGDEERAVVTLNLRNNGNQSVRVRSIDYEIWDLRVGVVRPIVQDFTAVLKTISPGGTIVHRFRVDKVQFDKAPLNMLEARLIRVRSF